MKRLPTSVIGLCAALATAVLAGGVGAAFIEDPPPVRPLPAPFRSAELVPGDVTLYLSIEGAACVRAELADRPISRWMNEVLAGGEAGRVWSQLAERAGIDPDELFDALLGRRLTVVVRTATDADDAQRPPRGARQSEWALLTEIDRDSRKAEKALRALRPIATGPKSRMAMLELPEHELLIARRGALMLIGPKQNASLFEEMLAAMRKGADGNDLANLVRQSPVGGRNSEDGDAGEPTVISRCDSPGVAGLFLRHESPLGGYSIVVADLAQEYLTIRHYGDFETSPFTRTISNIRIDSGVLNAFEEQAMVALVEPTDIGRTAFETFLLATTGEGLLSPKMRANLGKRRIIILGEVDGRQETEPVDAHLPAAALCFEIKDPNPNAGGDSAETDFAGFVEDLDLQMLRLAKRINHIGGAKESVRGDIPDPSAFQAGEHRRVRLEIENLAPPASLIPRTLNWTIANGPHGSYYVIATHPKELEGAVRAIGAGGRSNERADPHGTTSGRLDTSVHSCGVLNGPRLAHHLLALRDSELSKHLAGDNEAQREEFRAAIMLMSDLAAGLERVRWRLARPSETEVDLEVRIRLAPPISERE